MAEAQTLDPYAVDETQPITFTPREWFYFKEELVKQFVDEDLDTLKAIRRARYLAEIDRRFDRVEAGHWVEHDLIEANANG